MTCACADACGRDSALVRGRWRGGFITCFNVPEHAAALFYKLVAAADEGRLGRIACQCVKGGECPEQDKIALLSVQPVDNLPPLVQPTLVEGFVSKITWAV